MMMLIGLKVRRNNFRVNEPEGHKTHPRIIATIRSKWNCDKDEVGLGISSILSQSKFQGKFQFSEEGMAYPRIEG